MKELPKNFRYTKIIATIGPATESPEKLRELVDAGADVLRLNMAHATGQWVHEIVARIRAVSSELDRQVAVMMDVKGPEIRTGDLPEAIELNPGDRVRFVCNGPANLSADATTVPAGQKPSVKSLAVSVNYPMLARDVKVGGVLLVDSGLLRLKAIEKDQSSVLCEAINHGRLGSRRHINLPGVDVELPALTEKDIRDLRVGVEAGVDLIALSFVRRAADIHELKGLLMGLGSKAKIIAKIEEETGVNNMREIIRASDGIMVARGDLGIEIDYHRLPIIQRQLVEACLEEAKPVIIATQLLESMIEAPIPTRAEITDVSNAVREQADAVMLSGETTTGKHPIECVEVLKNIISSIQPTLTRRINERVVFAEPKTMMLRSAAVLAQELGQQGAGIIVFSRSGFLANMLGALRALGVPIFAFTDVETTYRQMVLPWGVKPFLIDFSEDPDTTIVTALRRLRDNQLCVPGAWLVVVTHVLAKDQVIETMQLRQV